jgi:acetyl-CoA carboxylase biotin carboxyl carrier protein
MADLLAPMGGKVIKILVSPGQTVNEDDELLILEAMKMEMPITAEAKGTVVAIKVEAGQNVEANQVLLVWE